VLELLKENWMILWATIPPWLKDQAPENRKFWLDLDTLRRVVLREIARRQREKNSRNLFTITSVGSILLAGAVWTRMKNTSGKKQS